VGKLLENCTTLKTKKTGLDFWQGRETFLFSKEPMKALGSTRLPIKWAQDFKRPRSETDHPPLPSTELKNKRDYTSTPTYVFMEYTETVLSPNY
jgi:hypothetical protein